LLLHHELRHVAQQRRARRADIPVIEGPASGPERDARELLNPHVNSVPTQLIQGAPEDEEYSLGTGTVDRVGSGAFGSRAWPFIKAVLEGFIGGLQADVKSGRAAAAKSHLRKLLIPWNAAKFYVNYLIGLVVGFVSPITDLVKGVIGLVKLVASALEWLMKWSPAGIAVSPERQKKIANLIDKLGQLSVEFGKSLAEFASDPKGTIEKFKGFFDDMMDLALGKAREFGSKAAHAIFGFLESDYSEMGRGVGEAIGALLANVLLLIFTDAIGNLVSKGASFLGKAAEFVGGRALEIFNWAKALLTEAVAIVRRAVKGALRLFQRLLDAASETFQAAEALFADAAAALVDSERVAAGVGPGAGAIPTKFEARAATTVRTSPADKSITRAPRVHPSNVGRADAPVAARTGFTSEEIAAEHAEATEGVRDRFGLGQKDPEKLLTKRKAFPREHRHHIFPRQKELSAWFKEFGIDIDKYTVPLGEGEHGATHKSFKQFDHQGWNGDWLEFKNNPSNAPFTEQKIFERAGQMMRKYLIDDLPIIDFNAP
jgi:hypothetical protein